MYNDWGGDTTLPPPLSYLQLHRFFVHHHEHPGACWLLVKRSNPLRVDHNDIALNMPALVSRVTSLLRPWSARACQHRTQHLLDTGLWSRRRAVHVEAHLEAIGVKLPKAIVPPQGKPIIPLDFADFWCGIDLSVSLSLWCCVQQSNV